MDLAKRINLEIVKEIQEISNQRFVNEENEKKKRRENFKKYAEKALEMEIPDDVIEIKLGKEIFLSSDKEGNPMVKKKCPDCGEWIYSFKINNMKELAQSVYFNERMSHYNCKGKIQPVDEKRKKDVFECLTFLINEFVDPGSFQGE